MAKQTLQKYLEGEYMYIDDNCDDCERDLVGLVKVRIKYLKRLFGIDSKTRLYADNDVLKIYAKIVFDYYENSEGVGDPFIIDSKYGEKGRYILFDVMANYSKYQVGVDKNDKPLKHGVSIREHGHTEYSTDLIVSFFMYFVENSRWNEISSACVDKHKEYLQEYKETLMNWASQRKGNNIHANEYFVEFFARALWDRTKLPVMKKLEMDKESLAGLTKDREQIIEVLEKNKEDKRVIDCEKFINRGEFNRPFF